MSRAGSRTKARARQTLCSLTSCLLLLPALATQVTAQGSATTTNYVTVTASSTSGLLNEATSRASTGSGAASASSLASAATSTAIPSLDLSGPSIPALLQRPLGLPTASIKSARPRVQTYFTGCADEDGIESVSSDLRLNISAVYAQYDPTLGSSNHLSAADEYSGGLLKFVGVGAIDSLSYGANNQTFSAIQVTQKFLTFETFSNHTFLCDELSPTGTDDVTRLVGHTSCTYGPGTVGFGVTVPLNSSYPLGTVSTRILLIDPSTPARAIACVDVATSHYDPAAWYWDLFFWLPVALFAAYFVLTALARIITAASTRSRAFKNRAREGRAPSFLRDHVNPVVVSAISGQGMVLSPALLRFCTPGSWEILFQLQFLAAIAMINVRWPDFSYPIMAQASWASLVGNVTLVQSKLSAVIDPLATNATLPTGNIASSFTDSGNPLYLDPQLPQSLLNLNGSYTGIPAYATVIGLNAGDMFGTCLAIWLLILAVFIAVAVLGWIFDTVTITVSKIKEQREDDGIDYQLTDEEGKGAKGGLYGVSSGEDLFMDRDGNVRDARTSTYGFLGVWPRGVHLSPHLHFAALQGNVVRALAMFHLPITIFSVWQFSASSDHTTKTVGLSIVAFVIVSVLLPALLLWRIAINPTRKLYDDIETLLAFGPVYNVFSPGSQLFWAVIFVHSLVLGIVVGAGWKSGTAQAIILLTLEVLLALATNLWLPWGEGAMVGPISFMTSVVRVITAVLVILLTPIVDLSTGAVGWITYVILLLQGIFFAVATLMLLIKLLEAAVRIFGRVPYDERVNSRSGGIGGAVRQIRRRRDNVLQLSQPRRRQANRHRSGHVRSNTASQSIMMSEKGARPNSLVGIPSKGAVGGYSNNQPTPLSRSRHASFGSYLDYNQAARGSQDMLQQSYYENGPYSTYFTNPRGDDEGHIMAAMPPPSPGMWGQRSAGPNGVPSRPEAGSVGFQRVGGARVSEAEPYGTMSTPPLKDYPDALRWDEQRDDSSTAAAAQFSRAQSRRVARSQHSHLAAGAAGGGFAGLLLGRRGRQDSADAVDADDVDDDDDIWGDTWGTSTLSTQHGPWNGIVKMQAALSAVRGRLTGHHPKRGANANDDDEDGGVIDEGDEDATPGVSGFQVIRAPRRQQQQQGHAAPPPVSSPPLSKARQTPQPQRSSWRDTNDEPMDSTAIAAAMSLSRGPSTHSMPLTERVQGKAAEQPQTSSSTQAVGYSQQQQSQPSSRQQRDRSPDASGSPHISATPPLLELRHLGGSSDSPDFNSSSTQAGAPEPRRPRLPSLQSGSALGILGADMHRAASQTNQDDAQEDAQRQHREQEDHYWLPPDRGNGGQGSFV
ncbi:unnamed protein product [Jaminaea pallidilutea]